MDMDPSSGQSQEIQGQPSLENMLVCSKSGQDQRKPRPAPEQALKCPRCDSTNTKFCYYNNYSLTQPRYFCKSCRRYWTKGGTLRNVPVGGGCRKNKRSSSSSTSSTPTSSASSKLRVQDHPHNNNNPLIGTHLPPLSYDSNDLTLAFARLQKQQSSNGHLGFDHHLPITSDFLGNPNSSSANFLDALRSGFLDTTTNTSATTTTTQMTNNNHHHLQNLYYGVNSNYSIGEVDQNGEMAMPYDHEDQMINGDGSSGATTQAVTVTTMKQELCNNINGSNYTNYGTTNVREDDQNKVLWGFPWQMNGNNNMGHGHDHHLDSATGRSSESWINGITGGSTWHGLLNSPLM